jgi:hypothetical protein
MHVRCRFDGVNWALLRHETPPYIPKRSGAKSTDGAASENGAFDQF